VELSYCIVNTNAREHLLACLEAIRRTHPPRITHEVLVLDNASDDGSQEAVLELTGQHPAEPLRLIRRDRRGGKAENDTLLLREARGELCLLLNEDAQLLDGAAEALIGALREHPRAAAAGAQLVAPDGSAIPCAWRLPGLGTALAQALFLHRLLVTQGGDETDEVGWVQSAAMAVRREAAADIGYLDPEFFVYSDETDFCKRLHDVGWQILHVPAARAIHHEQLGTDRSAGGRRVVEFHRGRDLYMRKHHSRPLAALARVLEAWAYVPRAAAALFLPKHSAGWYWLHARRALRPWNGEGLREAAAAYNRRIAQTPGRSSSRVASS
jgi:N-acetylglucosaminyl-diphospho-decaprenol L-rhamnosyltransferase